MPKPKGNKLTVKQQRFIEYYQGNASEAAFKAGYSKKTAPFIGAENLKKPKIIEMIRAREQKETAPHIATREDRQRFWADVMCGRICTKALDKDGYQIDIPPAMPDRLRASELLGKSNADFIDRHMVSVGGSHADLMDMNETDLEKELENLDV